MPKEITVQMKLRQDMIDDYNVAFNPLFTDWVDFYTTTIAIPDASLAKCTIGTLFIFRIKPE